MKCYYLNSSDNSKNHKFACERDFGCNSSYCKLLLTIIHHESMTETYF